LYKLNDVNDIVNFFCASLYTNIWDLFP
jgi:hypothetical protein